MIKAIFFDFNGVIIDDESIQMKAYHEILKEHAIDLTMSDYMECLGMDDRTFVRAIFQRGNKQLSDELLDSILESKTLKHRSMIEDEVPLFSGVVNFVKAAAHEVAVNIVSMASRIEVNYVLERAALESVFTVVVTAGDVSACKPAPDCYQFALAQFNEKRQVDRLLPLLPRECLAVEDSPPGVESARQAGMQTLAVTNTVSEAELRAAGANVVTRSLADWTIDAVRLVYQ